MVPHRASRPGAPAGVSAALVLLCGLSLAGAGGGDSHGLQHGQEDRIASASSTCSAGESGGNGKPPRQSRKQRQPQQQQMQLGEAAAADGDDAQRFAPNPSYANLPLDGYRRQRMFPQINTGYPGLQLIHERPFLFVVNGFLSSVECALLLQKAKELTPQPGSRPDSPSDSRNSVFASAKMAGVPEFRARIANLTGQRLEQLQPTKLSRYDRGDSFAPHSDAVPGGGGLGADRTDFYGDRARKDFGQKVVPYPGGNRFMTVFVYLNDVERGGRTRWRKLTYKPSFYDSPTPTNVALQPATAWDWDDVSHTIDIKPKAGMAVVFFPSTVPEMGGVTDHNVLHEAEEAIDTKYICQQFIYSHPPPVT